MENVRAPGVSIQGNRPWGVNEHNPHAVKQKGVQHRATSKPQAQKVEQGKRQVASKTRQFSIRQPKLQRDPGVSHHRTGSGANRDNLHERRSRIPAFLVLVSSEEKAPTPLQNSL